MLDVITLEDWQALFLTVKLAFCTAFLLLFLCAPLAWVFVVKQFWGKNLFLSLFNLPFILPPTVLGFYLLIFLGAKGWFGQFVQLLGLSPLPFRFSGLLVGSLVYSFPFAFQPLFFGFLATGLTEYKRAFIFNANPWQAFWAVFFPQALPAFFHAFLFAFAHTLGEFGVVLMIGGNIPGQTQVFSTLLYGEVESLHYAKANLLSLFALGTSFLLLLSITSWFGHFSGLKKQQKEE